MSFDNEEWTPHPKRKGYKPRKVLSNKKAMSTETKNSFASNDLNCSLFKVPPELRNRIYRLVLGGRGLHFKSSHRGGITVCSAAHTDRELTESAIQEGQEIGSKPWQGIHRECDRLAKSSYRFRQELGLLRVSRQIHSEACLLPFTTNTFIFADAEDLKHFAKRLVLEQRRSLTSIVIHHMYAQGPERDLPTRRFMDGLSGLRHVTVWLEIDDDGLNGAQSRKHVADEVKTATEALKYVNWESAVVCVNAEPIVDRMGVVQLSAADLRAASRELERILLQPWNKTEERKRFREAKEAKLKFEEDKEKAALEAMTQIAEQRQADRVQRGLRRAKTVTYSM